MLESLNTLATCLEYTGTIVKDSEIRSRIIDHDGRSVPVLCMLVELDNVSKTHIHAEQRFQQGQNDQAEHAAKRYTKGQRVTFTCPIADMQLFAGNTTHIHIHKHTQEPA